MNLSLQYKKNPKGLDVLDVSHEGYSSMYQHRSAFARTPKFVEIDNPEIFYTHAIDKPRSTSNYSQGYWFSSGIAVTESQIFIEPIIYNDMRKFSLITLEGMVAAERTEEYGFRFDLSETEYNIFGKRLTGNEYSKVFDYRASVPGLSLKDACVTYLMGLNTQQGADFKDLPPSIKKEIVSSHVDTQKLDISAYMRMYEDKKLTDYQRLLSKVILEHENVKFVF